MFPGLYDDQRRMLMRLAAMLTCGAASVLPLTAQTSLLAGAANAPAITMDSLPQAPPTRLTFPAFSVTRDPFVPETPVIGNQMIQQVDTVGDTVAQGMPIVRAVVASDNARALVEIDGSMRVVGIGDRLVDATVVQIDSAGILLSNGWQLGLQGSHN